MEAKASSAPAALGSRRRLHSAIALVLVICGVLYLLGASAFPPHLRRFSGVGGGPGAGPDATTLISTLVVVYTFFAAVYGTLATVLIEKKGRIFWRAWALIYIFLALILDLVRVWNSIGDLYETTMRRLSSVKVYDAADEFTRYLIVNSIVLLFALAVTFLPPDRLQTIWSELTGQSGATATQGTAPADAAGTDRNQGQGG